MEQKIFATVDAHKILLIFIKFINFIDKHTNYGPIRQKANYLRIECENERSEYCKTVVRNLI